MKKILISIIIFILLVLAYLMSFKTFKIGSFKVDSISDIKQMNAELNGKLEEANTFSKNEYPKKVESLENAIKKLTTVKNQYESKSTNAVTEDGMLATYLKNYKIETLMVDLGRYKNKNGLEDLRLDLKTNSNSSEAYDLQLTLVGPYDSIYNFIYDVENDDDLKFQISNLIVEPYMLKTKTTVIVDEKEDRDRSKTEYPYNLKETITSSSIGDSGSTSTSTSTNNSSDNNSTTNKQLSNAGLDNSSQKTTTNVNTNTSSNSSTKTDVVYDPKNVQAQFTVEGISISFD